MCVHSVDFDQQVIKMSFKGPRATVTGRYDVRGSVLGLPLNGQGDYQMVCGEYEYCSCLDTHKGINDLGILVRFASVGHMHNLHN